MRRLADRAGAGRELAERLNAYQRHRQAVVLGRARGGMPVAFEVARTLGLALDVFVVRKLGAPGQQELAIGAIASGGVRVLNRQMIAELGLSTAEIEAIAEHEQLELDAVNAPTAAVARPSRSQGDSPCSSTTASPPAPRCAPPFSPSNNARSPRSSSPSRSHRAR